VGGTSAPVAIANVAHDPTPASAMIRVVGVGQGEVLGDPKLRLD